MNEHDSRFFIDHGMAHDRKTGKHLVGCNYVGEEPETLLAVLQELERELWSWKQTARTFSVAPYDRQCALLPLREGGGAR